LLGETPRRDPNVAGGIDGNEAREILIFGAQTVAHPGAHRRPQREECARVQLERGLVVRAIVPPPGRAKTDVIGDGREARQQIGHHHAALPARANGDIGPSDIEFSRPTVNSRPAKGIFGFFPSSA